MQDYLSSLDYARQGRYARLDEGLSFLLVPPKPVIKQRLRLQLAVTVRGGDVSWQIGRQRGVSVT